MSRKQLDDLFRTLENKTRILILPHNNPDSDAIASTVALQHLLREKLNIEGQIRYKGIIGRAENKALVRYLNHPLRHLKESDFQASVPLAFVDTQPGLKISPTAQVTEIAIVIDHHALYDTSPSDKVGFTDVRSELGATSTILTDYVRAAELELPVWLATALFYGVKTSTMSLGRNTSSADAEAYYFLQPKIDVEALTTIETARVPPDYFKSFDATLRAARVYDGIVISYLGPMSYPDLTAEMADLLLRLEGSEWVICLGVYENILILSIRTRNRLNSADQLVQAMVGSDGTAGGHGTMAGGQIPLGNRDANQLNLKLTERALLHLRGVPQMTGKPLIDAVD